jgi:hypothetical protein
MMVDEDEKESVAEIGKCGSSVRPEPMTSMS